MTTFSALLVKFLMTFVFAGLSFTYFTANPLGWVFGVALIATTINYLIGDLLVLTSLGSIVASLGDGVMAAAVAYVMNLFVPVFTTTFGSLVLFGILVTIGEYFFHQYLEKKAEVEP